MRAARRVFVVVILLNALHTMQTASFAINGRIETAFRGTAVRLRRAYYKENCIEQKQRGIYVVGT